jgi:hypothetical protein
MCGIRCEVNATAENDAANLNENPNGNFKTADCGCFCEPTKNCHNWPRRKNGYKDCNDPKVNRMWTQNVRQKPKEITEEMNLFHLLDSGTVSIKGNVTTLIRRYTIF